MTPKTKPTPIFRHGSYLKRRDGRKWTTVISYDYTTADPEREKVYLDAVFDAMRKTEPPTRK
jgi:hypothetical protein